MPRSCFYRYLALLALLVVLPVACSDAAHDTSEAPVGPSATVESTTSLAPAITTSEPPTTTAPATTTSSPSTTTTAATTTTAPPTTTTTSATTTSTAAAINPPMACSWGSDTPTEHCVYWGYIESVDTVEQTLVFDLVRFESTGAEEYEFEIINNNPLVRTLRVDAGAAVMACPTAPGSAVPNECGDPTFDSFAISDLATWVANGYDFWGLTLIDDRVATIEQWWWP